MEFDFITRKAIAARVNKSVVHLNVLLREAGCPPLVEAGRVGPTFLYLPHTVDEWVPKFVKWESEAPARAAARKAEAARAAQAMVEQEQANLKLQREIAEGQAYVQASLAKRKAEDEARRQQILTTGRY